MKLKLGIFAVALIGIVLAVSASAPYDISSAGIITKLTENKSLLLVIALAIVLQIAGHWVRAVKHGLILNKVRPVKTLEVFKGQSIGYLFNFILPFRLGELVRAHYIARGVSISRSAVFATIIFERFIDVLVMIIIAVPLLMLLAGTDAMDTALFVLSFLCITAVILGLLLYSARAQKPWLLRAIFHVSSIFNDKVKDRFRLMCWSAIYVLKNAINRSVMSSYIGLTILMWGLYLGSTFILAKALLPGFSTTTHWLATEAGYYGISIPSGPAYLTTFQPIFTSLSSLTSSYLHDNGVTLIVWGVLVIPISLVGLVFLAAPHKKYHDVHNDMVTVLKNKLYRDVDITKQFAHFLDAYFRGSKINRILNSEELADNFRVIRTFRGGSSALTLLAWQDERMVVKKITLKQYKDKLKAQYDWLHERAQYPEIADVVREHDADDHYSIDIDYQEAFIPFFDVIHSASATQNSRTLNAVMDFMDDKVYRADGSSTKNVRLANKYIRTKAVGKVTDSSSVNIAISALTSYDTVIINGKEYDNFYQIIEKITQNKNAMADIATIDESPIHGDLTVDNIIVNPKDTKFIILDPNNENVISDCVVDIGKIMQSVHSGYEFLVLLTTCQIDRNEIFFEESKSHRYEELYKALLNRLDKTLPENKRRAVLFHEAMHYCRMLPYRCDINPETAPVFYAIAVRLFNEFYAQYD